MKIWTDPTGIPADGEGILQNFICDNTNEFAALPTTKAQGVRPGSMALVLVNSNGKRGLYTLSAARSWVLLAERSV